jgi:hypothetical protein
MSFTDLARGTGTSHVTYSGHSPRHDSTPLLGVYATSPFALAGDLPELTVSDPIPNTPMLAATDTAAPLDDPDEKAAGRYVLLYGLSGRPYKPRCIPPAAIGGMFVFPSSTAPASRSCLAMPESSLEQRFASAGEPFVTVRPATL